VTFLVGTSSVRDAQELAVTVSPNPSSEVITVTGDATASIIAYNLYTADGRLRRTFPVTNDGVARLDVSDLSAGTYHLMLTVPGGDVYRQAVSIIR
jgi:hypothetical protein